MVTQRTGVTVIAFTSLGEMLTTTCCRTDILGTGVVIFTIHRIPNANSGLAVVRYRAPSAIHALAFCQSR